MLAPRPGVLVPHRRESAPSAGPALRSLRAALSGAGLALIAGASGCAPGPDTVVAWRAGAAAWPENSRAALDALDPTAPVHVDVFLTLERLPVLNALPLLDPARCQTLAGNPLGEEVWLLQQDLPTLQAGWRCGTADPDFPEARIQPDTLTTLDELLERLEDGRLRPPTVHLQLGWTPNVSHDPAVFAAEVLERWVRTDTDAALVVVADTALMLAAARERADALSLPLGTALVWPRHPPKGSAGATELAQGLGTLTGTTDPVQDILDTGADTVWMRPATADRGLVRTATDAGLSVFVGPLRTAAQVRAFSRWPVDGLVAADPGARP